jgi:hypothetical protein
MIGIFSFFTIMKDSCPGEADIFVIFPPTYIDAQEVLQIIDPLLIIPE